MCPYCANPLTRGSGGRRPVQLIERTARRWKAVRALGWALVLVGVVVVSAEWVAGRDTGVTVAWCIALAGAACIAVSRAAAWWYHA